MQCRTCANPSRGGRCCTRVSAKPLMFAHPEVAMTTYRQGHFGRLTRDDWGLWGLQEESALPTVTPPRDWPGVWQVPSQPFDWDAPPLCLTAEKYKRGCTETSLNSFGSLSESTIRSCYWWFKWRRNYYWKTMERSGRWVFIEDFNFYTSLFRHF